jgi:hypothetical protein
LKEEEATSHLENKHIFEEEKREEESQLELSLAFSTIDSGRQNLLEKVKPNYSSSIVVFVEKELINLLSAPRKVRHVFFATFLPFSSSSCFIVTLVILLVSSTFLKRNPPSFFRC